MPDAGVTVLGLWTGVCCCHHDPDCISMTGRVLTGSPNVFSSSQAQGRLTDLTIGACGHIGRIITGTPVIFANGIQKAFVGSIITGCNQGRVIQGDTTHDLGLGGGSFYPLSVTPFQDRVIVHTEVDFGNVDDNPSTDDGLNIYPPVPKGQTPTAAQIAQSAALDKSPTTTINVDSTAAPDITAPPTSCLEVNDSPPDDFQLSTNFVLSDLSSNTAISKNRVRAQNGLTVQEIVCNLQGWAENIGEALSTQYSRSEILVTSGFRLGNGSSQHDRGQAADIQFPNFTWEQIYEVAVWLRDNVPFDQLILEYGGNNPWIHSSFNRAGNRPSTQFNKFGTRVSPGNYVWGELRNMS
jgi:uncharacterized Zn-binding protein involved in type VI secretion